MQTIILDGIVAFFAAIGMITTLWCFLASFYIRPLLLNNQEVVVEESEDIDKLINTIKCILWWENLLKIDWQITVICDKSSEELTDLIRDNDRIKRI